MFILDLIRNKEFDTCYRFLTDKSAFPNATFAALFEFSGTNADREIFIFPVQLTKCRTGNLIR